MELTETDKEKEMAGSMADDSMQRLHSIAEARVIKLEGENERLKTLVQLFEHENAILTDQLERALEYLQDTARKLSLLVAPHPSKGESIEATRSSE